MSNEYKRFRKTIHLAKKRHKCGICGRVIEAGELYEYWVGIWDYNFGVAKTCEKCVDQR